MILILNKCDSERLIYKNMIFLSQSDLTIVTYEPEYLLVIYGLYNYNVCVTLVAISSKTFENFWSERFEYHLQHFHRKPFSHMCSWQIIFLVITNNIFVAFITHSSILIQSLIQLGPKNILGCVKKSFTKSHFPILIYFGILWCHNIFG